MIVLYINGVLVDLNSEGIDISLNRKLTEARDFETRSGDFSFTLSLPKTKVNNVVFENANEPHQLDKFRRPSDFTAELYANGELILNGLFKITSIDTENYKGNLYGEAISWAELLEGINLREIDWEIPYNGPGTAPDEINGYNLALDAPVRFPLISYFPFPNTDPLNPPYEINGTTLYTIDQLPPQVSIREAVRRCFASIGFEVGGSMFSENWFKSLYMPYVGEGFPPLNYGALGGYVGTTGGTDTITFVNTTPPDQTTGAAVQSGYEFLKLHGATTKSPIVSEVTGVPFSGWGRTKFMPKYTGTHVFEIELNNIDFNKQQFLTVANPVASPRLAIMLCDFNDTDTIPYASIDDYIEEVSDTIDSSNVLSFYDFAEDYNPENKDGRQTEVLKNDYSFIISASTPGSIVPELVTGSGSVSVRFTVDLMAGNEVDFLLITNNIVGLSTTTFEYDAVFKINQTYPDQLRPAQLLPDITAKEFIGGILKHFNLWFSVQGQRVSFFDFDSFFRPDANAVNLDESATIQLATITPNQTNKQNVFEYDKDGADIRGGGAVGDITINSKNVYAGSEKVIKSLFAWTALTGATDTITGLGFKVPAIQSTEFTEQTPETAAFVKEFKPRLLQWVGILPGASFPVTKQGTAPATSVGLNTFDGSTPSTLLTPTGFSLRYDNAAGLATGLFTGYWAEWLRLLERSHIIELRAEITPALFRSLQLDTPVVFDSEIWYLLEINGYNTIEGGCTIRLIKKVF